MIIEFIVFAVFVSLLTRGIHAVTRPNKLLWFLGARIHAYDEINLIEDQKQARLNTVFEDFQRRFDAIECDDEERRSQMEDELMDKYQEQRKRIEEAFDMQIADRKIRAKYIEEKWYVQMVLSVAPMLTECLICMSSFWTIVVYLFHYSGVLYSDLLFIPVSFFFMPFVVAGMSTIFTKD